MENENLEKKIAAEETEQKERVTTTEAPPEKTAESIPPAEPPKTEEVQPPAEPPKKKKKPVRTLIKVVIWLIVSLVLLLGIAVSCILIFINPIIKSIIEDYGPEYAGVIFEIEDIDVRIFDGRIEIKNLCMYNPAGYDKTPYAVKLGDVAFDTKIMSWLMGPKTIIHELRIKDVTFNYEFDTKWEDGKLHCDQSNIKQIVDHVKMKLEQQKKQFEVTVAQVDPKVQYMFATQGPAPQTAQPAAPVKDDRRRFRLDKLVLENVSVNIVHRSLPLPVDLKPLTLTIPVKGPYGVDGKGLTGLEIAVALAPDLLVAIVESVSVSAVDVYKELKADIEQKSKDTETKIRSIVEKAKELKDSDDLEKTSRKGREILNDGVELLKSFKKK